MVNAGLECQLRLRQETQLNLATAARCRYQIKPAAALPVRELRRDLGAALRANYRGGMWFDSTTAHHNSAAFL
jgi:hypothetical protein